MPLLPQVWLKVLKQSYNIITHLDHWVSLNFSAEDIHLLAEEQVELGDDSKVDKQRVCNHADVILMVLKLVSKRCNELLLVDIIFQYAMLINQWVQNVCYRLHVWLWMKFTAILHLYHLSPVVEVSNYCYLLLTSFY